MGIFWPTIAYLLGQQQGRDDAKREQEKAEGKRAIPPSKAARDAKPLPFAVVLAITAASGGGLLWWSFVDPDVGPAALPIVIAGAFLGFGMSATRS